MKKPRLNKQGIPLKEIPSILRDAPMTINWELKNPYEGAQSLLYGISAGGAVAMNSLFEIIPANSILRLSGQEAISYTATQEGLWSYSGPPILKDIYEWTSGLFSIPTAYSN